MKTTDQILVIDLEATCWDGKQPTEQVSEIIEIGICLLNCHSGEITNNIGILIKPEKSTVSPFCTQLTTITQELLDEEGVSFSEACELLNKEYNSSQFTWASYGAYDIKMMKMQCDAWGVSYPFSDNHINVKELFAAKKGLNKKVGMNGALGILDFPLEGIHHRGVDDAKNLAKVLHWCLKHE